jgi:hypothetical protein
MTDYIGFPNRLSLEPSYGLRLLEVVRWCPAEPDVWLQVMAGQYVEAVIGLPRSERRERQWLMNYGLAVNQLPCPREFCRFVE